MVQLGFILLLSAASASAQSVYKCTLGDKISYGSMPCATGQSVALDLPAAPTPTGDARATLASQKREATQLARVRHKQEASDERRNERGDRAAARYRKRCATLSLHKKWAEQDAANARNGARPRLKARRAGETLALECPG